MAKLIERGLAGRGSRTVEAQGDNVESNRLARIASRFGKRVIFVEGLKSEGLSYGGGARQRSHLPRSRQLVIYLSSRWFPIEA